MTLKSNFISITLYFQWTSLHLFFESQRLSKEIHHEPNLIAHFHYSQCELFPTQVFPKYCNFLLLLMMSCRGIELLKPHFYTSDFKISFKDLLNVIP